MVEGKDNMVEGKYNMVDSVAVQSESYPSKVTGSVLRPDWIIPAATTISTILIFSHLLFRRGKFKLASRKNEVFKSIPLPGFGIFGDQLNEFFGILLDALAVYVHK